jgi:hypothetical protein
MTSGAAARRHQHQRAPHGGNGLLHPHLTCARAALSSSHSADSAHDAALALAPALLPAARSNGSGALARQPQQPVSSSGCTWLPCALRGSAPLARGSCAGRRAAAAAMNSSILMPNFQAQLFLMVSWRFHQNIKFKASAAPAGSVRKKRTVSIIPQSVWRLISSQMWKTCEIYILYKQNKKKKKKELKIK